MTDTLCVCGHAAEPHAHHRDGRDCSRCGRELCREFRPLTWWRRVLNRVGWYPAPLPDPVPAVDFTSLFTPARFQVIPREAAWHAGADQPLFTDIPTTYAPLSAIAGVDPLSSKQWAPPLDSDGRPIEVGDWVEILTPPRRIGEVVETLGAWCEVRIPPGEAMQAEHGARLRVIDEEES